MRLGAVVITLLSLVPVMQSCFTGIEGTPRITGQDARRAGVAVTEENVFASSILPESPRSWAPGKQWKVADNKISMLFTGNVPGSESLSGSVITLKGVQPVTSLTGEKVMQLSFVAPSVSAPMVYTTDIPEEEWDGKPSFAIPFTVEMSAVDKADSLMRGKTFYIMSPLWYDPQGQAINGLHYIPVEIKGVRAGTANLPLMVAFKPLGLGDDIPVCYIYMTFGAGYAASRNFDRLFSFSDPRTRYPRITDDHWRLIVGSRIARGMTREEVRLALGNPDSVDRGATRGGFQIEQWSYSNGMYAVFEDDILIRVGR